RGTRPPQLDPHRPPSPALRRPSSPRIGRAAPIFDPSMFEVMCTENEIAEPTQQGSIYLLLLFLQFCKPDLCQVHCIIYL
uniref:Uncharacterized protein n=1 Tax=Triticum urartu TaxID=4572 RepID=A0A8R7UF11_TRIUA